MRITSLLQIFIVWACFFVPGIAQNVFNDSKQLVVVLSPHSASVTARLWRFEKQGKNWQMVGTPYPVNLGKKGLAWGRGLHSAKPGVQKKEGDQKSPAGLFRFGEAFGYAAPESVDLKLPYTSVTESLICVEDGGSRHYNQIVDAAQVPADWQQRESMMRKDEQYKWGIFVKHNLPPEPGGGSCIFFHLWNKPGSGTLGCTAMAEENMLELMQWLDPSQKPLLMQMTESDYKNYRKKVNLPVLE